MSLATIKPGTTIKFPLSVKMDTVKQNRKECSVDCGPLALTLVEGKKTSSQIVNHVPYAPGGINYAETDSEVLSGIFTGCVMTLYTHAGRRRVAHVHTGGDAGPGLDCKDLMKSLLASPSYKLIFAFKPYQEDRDIDTFVKIAAKSEFADRGVATFGLVTTAGKCYAIFTRKVTIHEYIVEAVTPKTLPYEFV